MKHLCLCTIMRPLPCSRQIPPSGQTCCSKEKELALRGVVRMKSLCLLLLAVAGASAFTTCPLSLSPAHRRSNAFAATRMCAPPGSPMDGEKDTKKTMQRPAADNIITSLIYTVEMARVKLMSEKPSEGNGYWEGEPKEWAEDDSIAQKVSSLSQVGPVARFKQWIAESIAGDYDPVAINKRIDDELNASPVVMFSFTTCPFCLKSKTLLNDTIGIKQGSMKVIECDEDEEGNAIRAELGKRTGRTSMPSIWVRGEGYLGGCNDGPGVMPLNKEGKLAPMLKKAGAL